MKKEHEWSPVDSYEEKILESLLDNLGEFTSVEKLSAFFRVHKNTIYNALDSGEIYSMRFKGKNLIHTRSLLPLVRRNYE